MNYSAVSASILGFLAGAVLAFVAGIRFARVDYREQIARLKDELAKQRRENACLRRFFFSVGHNGRHS